MPPAVGLANPCPHPKKDIPSPPAPDDSQPVIAPCKEDIAATTVAAALRDRVP